MIVYFLQINVGNSGAEISAAFGGNKVRAAEIKHCHAVDVRALSLFRALEW